LRVNGRGVNLNRNFPAGWIPGGRAWDAEYPGPRPFSEPETRIARRVVLQLRPQITIWFHQQTQPLVRAWGRSIPAARSFALWSGLPFVRMQWVPGSAPHWQNSLRDGGGSFVVELPPRPLRREETARYAAALERLAGYRGQNSQDLARRRGAAG
jgi:protein MpaA